VISEDSIKLFALAGSKAKAFERTLRTAASSEHSGWIKIDLSVRLKRWNFMTVDG
jgi:hypothetical protein